MIKSISLRSSQFLLTILFSVWALNLIMLSPAFSDTGLAGTWNGSVSANDGSPASAISFVLHQDGTIITGEEGADGTVFGYLTGSDLHIRIGFVPEAFAVDYYATTDGHTMSGTYSDTKSRAGTFVATKVEDLSTAIALDPTSRLTIAPNAKVSRDAVALKFQKFKKPTFKKKSSKAVVATFRYDVKVKGAEKLTLTSTKNSLSVKNLKAGKYSVTYRVTALKNGKKAYSTNSSPSVSFTIKKR